jgi:catechol 2,3-dioxygenase-like lactoylglutathione lyase family enzyme
MFDHVKFGVSDYAASKAFFLKALEPLGVAVVSEGPRRTVSNGNDYAAFVIGPDGHNIEGVCHEPEA